MTPEQRFWAKVDKSSPTECWIWKAAKHRNGYGNFWTGKRPMLAHRYAYTILVGPILTGLQIDHLCRNRACVNPAHMEPVTLQENLRRGQGFSSSARSGRIACEVMS